MTKCLAGQYASQLRTLHALCESDAEYEIDVLGYSHDAMVQNSTPNSTNMSNRERRMARNSFSLSTNSHPHMEGSPTDRYPAHTAPSSFSPSGARIGGTSGARGSNFPMQASPHQIPVVAGDDGQSQSDGLAAISHTLMNDDFLAMDRIITLDDMIFAAPGGTPLPWMTTDMS